MAEAATPELIPDERIMNTLHKMPDHMEQTMVVSQKRGAEDVHRTSRIKDRTEGCLRKWRRGSHMRKCQDAAEARAIFNGILKTLFEQSEALEKHVKTVTMRAEALATTQVDFFKALIERHEEAQKHLNELAAQLS